MSFLVFFLFFYVRFFFGMGLFAKVLVWGVGCSAR